MRNVSSRILPLFSFHVSWLLQLWIASNFVASLSTTSENRIATSKQSNFKTERNVIIRAVPWCGGILPLQIYSGMSLPSESLAEKRRQYTDSSLEVYSMDSKERAEERASRPLDPHRHLHILYDDADICVVHKPSGVLCVPGPRRNPSVANLVYDYLQPPDISIDQMVVHRLDMDTSGIVVFALTERALKQLHQDFRNRLDDNKNNNVNTNRVHKTYEALVCGHILMDEGEIDLALERDPTHIPFMRVSTATYPPNDVADDARRLSMGKFAKFIDKAPKPSYTTFRVLSRFFLLGKYPVTRVELKPVTGRTHQLRVHCAAIGHPILGDDIYGLGGEGSMNGGLSVHQQSLFSSRASLPLQYDLLRDANTHLCLHAKRLCIYHPFSGAPMMFEAKPNF